MFKAPFGSAAVFALLVLAFAAPAGTLRAQEGTAVREGAAAQEGVAVHEGVPVQPEAAPGEGVAVKGAREEVVPAEAGPKELSDEEIRQVLVDQSLERFRHWKRRKGFSGARGCGDYDGVHGPQKPDWVYCNPDDISVDQIQLYRETQREQRSTFINEPPVKF